MDASPRAAEYRSLENEYERAVETRGAAAQQLAATNDSLARSMFADADAAVRDVRARALNLVKEVTGDSRYTDVNYVFPTFVLRYMPVGLVGLMIAAILAAAMSASSGELNALATATMMDFYRRHFNPAASDARMLVVSKIATGFWALFACGVAVHAANIGSLIEVVNRFGSLFYGSVLGVFILALGVKRANGHGAFIGLIVGLATVFTIAFHPATNDLWAATYGRGMFRISAVAAALAPAADFAASPSRLTVGRPVLFVDTSANSPTSWSWSFGDPASGTNNLSALKNPEHTFAVPGVYTVALTAAMRTSTCAGPGQRW